MRISITASSTLDTVRLFDICQAGACEMKSCGFNLISLITNEDEYIFIYLWNVWVSSTVRSLFKFSCCFYTAVLLYPCVSWSSNIFVHIYEHCGYIHAKLYTLLYFCAEVWIIPLECNLLIFFSTTKSKHWYFIFHFLSSFYLDVYICFFFKCLVFPFIF